MKKLPAVLLCSIAFAFVESAVVEYLRALYYPLAKGGFQFPLQTLDELAALGAEHLRRLTIELGREVSTLVMLAMVGLTTGKNSREAWAYFVIAFGTWDIFYYIWLKIFIDWPANLLTWDLLFLVPIPWVAPVLAPILISLVMIICGVTVLFFESTDRPLKTRPFDWFSLVSGGLIVIVSFCWDYENIMAGGFPAPFKWSIFLVGLLIGILSFINIVVRNLKQSSSKI